MKTRTLIIIITIFAILGITLLTLFSINMGKEVPYVLPISANENPPEISKVIPEKQPKTHYVEIVGFGYSPEELIINKGDTVVWTNTDKRTSHTVTSTSSSELKSKFLKHGENYTHTFNEEGRFFYYCIPHTSVHGKIIVK